MRAVELVPGIRSSALGFGCAPILGSVGAKTAQRALDCAIDFGVTHFDLARSYGYGEAEKFVGKILKDRRNQVVIASKFGIQANWKASLLKPIKPLVRFIRSKEQPNKQTKPEGLVLETISLASDRFHDRLPYRASSMQKSLERSLRALGTDYLDYLFIHEPHESLTYIDELTEYAQRLKDSGKIRAFGLAYMNKQKQVHEAYAGQFDVLQFDRPINGSAYEALVNERSSSPNVIFSPMRGGSPLIKPLDKLQQLAGDFPNSVILCSMFNEKHIRANASTI